jgi:dGTPase
VRSIEDVRRAPHILVGPGPEVRRLKSGLEEFLRRRVYRHYRVMRMAAKGRRLLHLLFDEFCRAPELLPERYGRRAVPGLVQRTVCDYLAGMTDRYAQDEYLRLFQPYTAV